MKTNDTKLMQWKKRIVATRFIYSILVYNWTKDEAIKKFQTEIQPLANEDINKIITVFILRKSSILKLIESKLTNNWSLDRLNTMDLAILCESVGENIGLNIDKKIIIDQAIITAKKYCEPNSYKFINSILDKILK